MDAAIEIALPRRAAPRGPEASHLDELLDRHESRLRRVAYGMLGDHHTVEDVLQDALIKVFRHLPRRFESIAEESAWLYQIVYRCCIDELRRRKRRLRTTELHEEIAAAHDPDAGLAVLRALAELPEDARAAVLLVDVVGLDYTAAGRIVGVPAGTLGSRLSHARARLRSALA